jgi:hypothetical protein
VKQRINAVPEMPPSNFYKRKHLMNSVGANETESRMNNQMTATLISVAASIGLLVVWFYAGGAPNSGWLLFFSIIAAIAALIQSANSDTQAPAAIILGTGFVSVWYFASASPDAGWLLFTLFLSVLGLFSGLNHYRQR